MSRVWVNGTFDVIHYGHIKLFEYAASFGKLKVGIDSDSRVKSLKGENRPFNKIEYRKTILESIKFVDSINVFDTDDELINLVKNYKPDYFIIGDDYINKNIIGAEFAKKILFYQKIDDISTTKILNYNNKKNE